MVSQKVRDLAWSIQVHKEIVNYVLKKKIVSNGYEVVKGIGAYIRLKGTKVINEANIKD